jgi:hypothetical protein
LYATQHYAIIDDITLAFHIIADITLPLILADILLTFLNSCRQPADATKSAISHTPC